MLGQFQYKVHLCSNGYSLTKRCYAVVMLLKRFFDGAKSDLSGVIHSNKGCTIVQMKTLLKVLLSPTEITYFEWQRV
ncbi:hypothetical protein CXF79_15130 [Colwellia sp. Bg11-28]|nr:hypothetical protein CXF79_15130 [Colwellia sp. Bg11-28]